ncbi:MAG: hypothetical protein JWN70_4178 [Planctomycetaceae bacterium]|nr:hypothetical protein [Planctomycetaceae bacterium]
MEAKKPTPVNVKWDDYFPLLNKAILGLLVLGAMMIATGVDLVQLGGKVLGGGDNVESVSAADAGEPVPGDFGGSAKPATGIAAWRNVIVAITVMLGVVVFVFYILSVGGRDAERMKEQQAAVKKDQQPDKADGEKAQPAAAEEEECNLSSYKMFYPAESATSDK